MNLEETRAEAQKFYNFFRLFEKVNEFLANVAQMEAQTSVAKSNYQVVLDKIEEAKKNLTEIQNSVESVKGEIKKMQSDASAAISGDRAAASQEIETTKVAFAGELEKGHREIAALQAEKDSLVNESASLKAEIVKDTVTLEEIMTQISTLRVRFS